MGGKCILAARIAPKCCAMGFLLRSLLLDLLLCHGLHRCGTWCCGWNANLCNLPCCTARLDRNSFPTHRLPHRFHNTETSGKAGLFLSSRTFAIFDLLLLIGPLSLFIHRLNLLLLLFFSLFVLLFVLDLFCFAITT